jgi:phage terminase large subunit GpA-like protein
VPKKGQGGKVRYIWDKDPTQANEGLDTRLQAEAAWIRIAGPQRELLDKHWDRRFAEREMPPDEAQLDLEDFMTAGSAVANTAACDRVMQPRAPAPAGSSGR